MRSLRTRRVPMLAATGLVLAILGAGYLLADGRVPARRDPDSPSGILVALADQAIADHRLVAPAGQNAYEFYLSVLQLAPEDLEVRERMRALLPQASATVERAINQGELDEAARELRLLRDFDADNYTLALLGGKLDAQRQLTIQRDEALARAMQARAESAQPR